MTDAPKKKVARKVVKSVDKSVAPGVSLADSYELHSDPGSGSCVWAPSHIGPHSTWDTLKLFVSVSYSLNTHMPLIDLFEVDKQVKNSDQALETFSEFPLGGSPVEVSMLAQRGTQNPVFIYVKNDDTESLYNELCKNLTDYELVPTTHRDGRIERCDWFGDSCGFNRQALRLGAYRCSVDVLDVMHRISYGQTAYEFSKAVNVSGMRSVKVNALLPLLINAADSELTQLLPKLESLQIPHWHALESCRVAMRQLGAYQG